MLMPMQVLSPWHQLDLDISCVTISSTLVAPCRRCWLPQAMLPDVVLLAPVFLLHNHPVPVLMHCHSTDLHMSSPDALPLKRPTHVVT